MLIILLILPWVILPLIVGLRPISCIVKPLIISCLLTSYLTTDYTPYLIAMIPVLLQFHSPASYSKRDKILLLSNIISGYTLDTIVVMFPGSGVFIPLQWSLIFFYTVSVVYFIWYFFWNRNLAPITMNLCLAFNSIMLLELYRASAQNWF